MICLSVNSLLLLLGQQRLHGDFCPSVPFLIVKLVHTSRAETLTAHLAEPRLGTAWCRKGCWLSGVKQPTALLGRRTQPTEIDYNSRIYSKQVHEARLIAVH